MDLIHNPDFWVGVGFVAVIVLLIWKGAPKFVAAALDRRAAAISAELEEARRLREEASALLAEYRARGLGAEKESEAILANARAEAQRFAEDSRAALKSQIERRAQAAQDRIAQAEAAAVNEIRGRAADTAVAAAEKLIATRLDEKRAASLIDTSIKDLGAKLN